MADAIDDGLIKALEELTRFRPPTSETFSYQADGYAAGWSAAINSFQAKARDQIKALSRHKAPLSVAGDDVIVAVRDAIWREDHYDPKLCSHSGDGGRSCAYCEPHDDPTPEDWPADKERAERQARAALTALQVTEGDKR